MKQTFWLVWNPQRGSPARRHLVEKTARIEAQRLADKVPGEIIYILNAVGLAFTPPKVSKRPDAALSKQE